MHSARLSTHARPSLPLVAHLAIYFICSLTYAFTAGRLGHSYGPLATYQTYAVATAVALVLALIGGRLSGIWKWRAVWPPSVAASKAALASVLIMTASTLALLSPSSLLSIVAGKAGRLLLVARVSSLSAMVLPGLGIVAVVLAAWTKPPIAAVLPLLLAGVYVLGYWIKLRAVADVKEAQLQYDLQLVEAQSVAHAKVGHVRPWLVLEDSRATSKQITAAIEQMKAGSTIILPQPTTKESPEDFLAAEQALVAICALVIASLMAHHVSPAPITNWRLWLLGAASLGAGLIGTRIMLRKEESAITFPAYSMASLLASLGASWVRGELRWAWASWPMIAAAVLALVVVGGASGGFKLAARWWAAVRFNTAVASVMYRG